MSKFNQRLVATLAFLGVSFGLLFNLARADALIPRAYLPIVMRQVTGTFTFPTQTPTLTATPVPNPVLRINSGGPTYGSWQDGAGSGGTTAYGVDWTTNADTILISANSINNSLAPNTGPMQIYQTARTKAGGFTYTISNLIPSELYLLRLHFSENWNASRTFSVSVNGTTWWPNQSAQTVAGGMFTAYILDVNTPADANGQLVIQFTPGNGDPIINGIEAIYNQPPFCVLNVVDPINSAIQIQNNPTWADNESLLNIKVLLFDNCGNSITDNRPVTLISSRPSSDTISTPNPNISPNNSNVYTFTVRSNIVGTSIFTAQVSQNAGGTGPIVSIIGINNPGQFACLIGVQTLESNPKQLAISYTNPALPSANRRLVQLQANWGTLAGTVISNILNQVALGNSSNEVWLGSANTPVYIGQHDWTSVFRTIASAATRVMFLDFANQVQPPAGSQWRYTITATWDNGFNASFCSSSPVVINLP